MRKFTNNTASSKRKKKPRRWQGPLVIQMENFPLVLIFRLRFSRSTNCPSPNSILNNNPKNGYVKVSKRGNTRRQRKAKWALSSLPNPQLVFFSLLFFFCFFPSLKIVENIFHYPLLFVLLVSKESTLERFFGPRKEDSFVDVWLTLRYAIRSLNDFKDLTFN